MTALRPRTLRRILIALAVAALLSAAHAQTHLSVDDSGVDYTNHDLEEAFIGMDFHDGRLVLLIDDEAFDGSMPAIDFEVPDLEKEDFFGNDIGAELSDIDELTWRAVGNDRHDAPALHEVSYRHHGLTLADALELYSAAFEALGFEVELAPSTTRSVWNATCRHGEDTVQIRLQAFGPEVRVNLVTL